LNDKTAKQVKPVDATGNRLARLLAMLLMPMLVTIVIACDSGASGNSGNTEPYANSPEGKPKYLPNPVPDPPEVLETKPAGQMPDFLAKATGSSKDKIAASYAGAVEHFDQYKYIPCYCGCAIYTTAHSSLASCYIKERTADGAVTFTDHSLTCDKCQQAAEMTLAGIDKGQDLKATRAEIFAALKYTDLWTDTPPIP
jgi:hypothetical protein